jgi:hypothetical protein
VEPNVSIEVTPTMSYRAREAEVTIAELDDFIERAIADLAGADAAGPPFAVFHGAVDETTRSRVEVGVPAADGDRVLRGGYVVSGTAVGDTGYEPIHRVYDAVKAFIVANGFTPRGPTREIYRGRERFSDEITVVWPIHDPEDDRT